MKCERNKGKKSYHIKTPSAPEIKICVKNEKRQLYSSSGPQLVQRSKHEMQRKQGKEAPEIKICVKNEERQLYSSSGPQLVQRSCVKMGNNNYFSHSFKCLVSRSYWRNILLHHITLYVGFFVIMHCNASNIVFLIDQWFSKPRVFLKSLFEKDHCFTHPSIHTYPGVTSILIIPNMKTLFIPNETLGM